MQNEVHNGILNVLQLQDQIEKQNKTTFISFMLSPLSKHTKNFCNDECHCRGKNESWKAMEVAEEKEMVYGDGGAWRKM